MTSIIFGVFMAFLVIIFTSLVLTVVYLISLMILEIITDAWHILKRAVNPKPKRQKQDTPTKSEIVDNIYEQAYQRVVEKDRSESKK